MTAIKGIGESLRWAGAPRQGVFLRSMDVFLIPFSLMWGGFAFFWEVAAIAARAPFFFMFWGVPFVLVGVYMLAGRFFVDAYTRSKTVYALTDRRVIIVSGILSRSIQSLSLRTLSDVSLTEHRDGRGTVRFGRAHPFAMWYEGMHWPGQEQYAVPTFERVEEPKRIYDSILHAQNSAG
jgi:hypothetical protein